MIEAQIPDRLVSYPQLDTDWGIKYSRVHLARLEKAGSFPLRIRASERRIGWLSSELRAWMSDRAAARTGGAA